MNHSQLLASPAGLAIATDPKFLFPAHLRALNVMLLELSAGRINRLLVTMPPRHGKSETCSKLLPAWFLASAPNRRVILASYEREFAAMWGAKVRDLIAQHGALYQVAVKPGRRASHHTELTNGSIIHTAGIGGPITGRGADVLIIDDPIKNAEQAASRNYRDKCWDWYTSTAYTRLEPGGRILLIQTRWHEDDLAGRLTAENTTENWTQLDLPAICETDNDPIGRTAGQALWPERFDLQQLAQIRTTLGPYYWSALYQQQPAPPTGRIFQRQWFQAWQQVGHIWICAETPHDDQDCWRFGTVDLALREDQVADYTVIASWAVTPAGDLILLELIRDRLQAPKIIPELHKAVKKHHLDYIAIEKAGFQESLIQHARAEGITAKPIYPRGDKQSRAHAAAIRFAAGKVYFPPTNPYWLESLKNELLNFPTGTHDDTVDATVMACLEVARRQGDRLCPTSSQ